MALKAIFFDAAGTLIKSSRPIGETYALIARSYGREVSPREIAERFRACFSSAPPLAFPGADPQELPALEHAWWKDLVRRIFEPFGAFENFDGYFAELFRYFSRADSWTPYDESKEILAALRERGYALAVISNFDSRLLKILEGLGLDSYFRSVILSSHIGYAKPAPQIFQKALALFDLKAEEALHIGDSPDNDAAGASSAGLKTALLDRNGKAPSNSFPRIRNLKEILDLIERWF